ncbi:MAG: hypothetical protein DI613_13330 [Kocuria rhizophila]|nr:MAG: hypothetical protein DI613_13330 [Kocuria rhizophila]
MSIKKTAQTLRPLQQITVVIAGHLHVAADPLTDIAREILTATRAPAKSAYGAVTSGDVAAWRV